MSSCNGFYTCTSIVRKNDWCCQMYTYPFICICDTNDITFVSRLEFPWHSCNKNNTHGKTKSPQKSDDTEQVWCPMLHQYVWMYFMEGAYAINFQTRMTFSTINVVELVSFMYTFRKWFKELNNHRLFPNGWSGILYMQPDIICLKPNQSKDNFMNTRILDTGHFIT